ncbi:MAG: nuclear transport factor 2 family protein [Chloroflexi bacterium]|nr:MAG: nuclear transport factor 2 family protein [Chloroflexota bacterium]
MSQEPGQDAQTSSSPKLVFERMIQAANRHDLEAMVAFFAPGYRSEQPFHPERNFVGQAGVRKNWSFFFATIPDIQIEVLGQVEEGDIVWAELSYHGTQTDGKKHAVRGVAIQSIQGDQIAWARLYIETLSGDWQERLVSDLPDHLSSVIP